MNCNCGLIGGNNGHCPWASSDVHYNYANSMKKLSGNMIYCHSKDRENLVAYGECGYQSTSN